MSAAAMVAGAKAILVAACPTATVYDYAPKAINIDPIVYVQHVDAADVDKAAGGQVMRTHTLTIRLMVKATSGDEEGIEQAFLALSDLVASAFYGNHRSLGGAAQSVNIAPVQSGDYLWYKNEEFRQREWKLTATEYLYFTY